MSFSITNQSPNVAPAPQGMQAAGPASGSPAMGATTQMGAGTKTQITVDSKGKEKKKDAGCAAMPFSSFGLLIVMFVAFYFILIRPQQKRQKEHNSMLNQLIKGDKVVTSGGILGTIVSLTDRYATLEVSDKMKIRVLRSHIAGKQTLGNATAKNDEQPSGKKSKKSKKDNA